MSQNSNSGRPPYPPNSLNLSEVCPDCGKIHPTPIPDDIIAMYLKIKQTDPGIADNDLIGLIEELGHEASGAISSHSYIIPEFIHDSIANYYASKQVMADSALSLGREIMRYLDVVIMNKEEIPADKKDIPKLN